MRSLIIDCVSKNTMASGNCSLCILQCNPDIALPKDGVTCTSVVFPTPGGPVSNTPPGHCTPRASHSSLNCHGQAIYALSFSVTPLYPANWGNSLLPATLRCIPSTAVNQQRKPALTGTQKPTNATKSARNNIAWSMWAGMAPAGHAHEHNLL